MNSLPPIHRRCSINRWTPAPTSTIYLAGEVDLLQALFHFDDGGRTWVRIKDNDHQFGCINHVTGDPRIYGRVYFRTAGRGIICGDPVLDSK